MDSRFLASLSRGMTLHKTSCNGPMKASCSACGATARSSVILELMTQERGRHLGLVRGGTGKRLRGVLQPGNSLRATWRARLDDHLGNYAVEGVNLRAAGFLSAAHAVHGVTHLAAFVGFLPNASRMRACMARSKRSSMLSTIPPRSLP